MNKVSGGRVRYWSLSVQPLLRAVVLPPLRPSQGDIQTFASFTGPRSLTHCCCRKQPGGKSKAALTQKQLLKAACEMMEETMNDRLEHVTTTLRTEFLHADKPPTTLTLRKPSQQSETKQVPLWERVGRFSVLAVNSHFGCQFWLSIPTLAVNSGWKSSLWLSILAVKHQFSCQFWL